MAKQKLTHASGHLRSAEQYRAVVLFMKIAVQVHVGPSRVYQHLICVVVQIKRNVQRFFGDLHPFAVLAFLLHLPGNTAIVVTLGLLKR